jgi:hypothetical protein
MLPQHIGNSTTPIDRFASLEWYDKLIEFIFRFTAKTSEPLLAAGTVYSAAHVLSRGHIGSSGILLNNVWAIVPDVASALEISLTTANKWMHRVREKP